MSDPEVTPETEVAPGCKKSVTDTVKLEPGAVSMLNTQAGKLGIPKRTYASAAIRFFGENGLDPTQTTTLGEGIKTRAEVSEASYDIRKQAAEIGNRLVSIVRAFERELFKVLEAQQEGTVEYLARIEENLLTHQVAVRTQLLTPMLERIIRSGVETHMSRRLLEILLLKKEGKFSTEELEASTAGYDERRDQQILVEARKFLEAARLVQPILSTKPVIARPMPPAPKQPAAPAASKT